MSDPFDREREMFANSGQRVAWHFGASLAPFVTAIPADWPAESAEALATGEAALHSFFTALYTDMYYDPAAYGLAVGPDLAYDDGHWAKEQPEVQRVCNRQAHVGLALELLYGIGHVARLEEDCLVLSAAQLQALLDELRPRSVSRPRIRGFLAALVRHGLTMTGDDELTLRAAAHPGMLTAMHALCRYGDETERTMRLFAFSRCDLAAMQSMYMPDVASVLGVLSATCRAQAEQVIAHMAVAGYPMALQAGGYPSAAWTLLFEGHRRVKAGTLLRVGYSAFYRHRFFIELHCINPIHLIPLVEARGEAYAAWFSAQLPRDCTGCGYCQDRFTQPGPYLLQVGAVRRALCHANWLTMRNPSPERLADLLRLVDLHTAAGAV